MQNIGTVRLWVLGARPRTLAAAVVPVMVGAAVAVGESAMITDNGVVSDVVISTDGVASVPWWRIGPVMLVALALQVAVNYANDYSDGIRGTDEVGLRLGPPRLVGSGMAPASQVKKAMLAAFSVAVLAGSVLTFTVDWWLALVGFACIFSAWGYTGGSKPYGYVGLGEVSVFVFFGLIATVGTTYVLLERFDWLFVVVSVPVGLWAVALLLVNNLRDIAGDKSAGKLTLAVRIGEKRTKVFYVLLVIFSYVIAIMITFWGHFGWGALAGFPFAVLAMLALRKTGIHSQRNTDSQTDVSSNQTGMTSVFINTARLQIVSGLGLAIGLVLA